MDPRRSRGLAMVVSAGVLYGTPGLFTRALRYDAWRTPAGNRRPGGLRVRISWVTIAKPISWSHFFTIVPFS